MNNDLKIKIPEAPGLVFVKAEKVSLKKIKSTKDNLKVNTRKLDIKTLNQFKSIIRRDRYNTEIHIPPCVTEDYELISGEHKYQAHLALDKQEIVVAVVKFIEYDNMPADFWLLNWQSVENDPANDDFVRNPRDDNQIIQTILKQIDLKLIEPTEKAVNKSLIYQKVSPTRRKFFISAILNNTQHSSKICKVYDSDLADNYIDQNYSVELSTPTKIILNEDDDTVYFKQQFKKPEDKKDYDNRVLFNYIEAIKQYPNADVKIFSYIDDCNETRITEVREAKLKLIDKKINSLREFIKKYDNKELKNLEFIFLPQTQNDFKNDTK
jgi:hypothetical protein